MWGDFLPYGVWPYGLVLALILGMAGVIVLRRRACRGLERLVQGSLHKGGGSALIVLAQGDQRTLAWLVEVRELIAQTRPDADILFLQFPSHPESNADTFQIAEQMCRQISDQFEAGEYVEVILVGYSRGALLLRKAFVYGNGLIQDLETVAGETRAPLAWTGAVRRFVLLAGMNRGWSLRRRLPTMSVVRWLWFRFMGRIARIIRIAGQLRQYENGHPFVANLRIQWLDLMRSLAPDLRPVVIQLLGDRDDLVSSEDQRDVTVARDFIWVKVANTNHFDIINLADPVSGPERQDKIKQALGDESAVARLKRLSSKLPDNQDPDVRVVVVVLHGIRDMAAWTQTFENPLQEAFALANQDNSKLHVHRPSYDFFGMLPFLLWSDRQANVRWFMDEFTELKAKFPKLEKVHFIGHSNGTYVLASALDKYKTLEVGRIAFAGSVVRRDYDWDALGNRFDRVRNYVGSMDWVVGWFPRLFEMWPFSLFNRDIGSAGFDGFIEARGNSLETKYVRGAHSAALVSQNIPSIVDFIINGKPTPPPTAILGDRWTLMDYSSRACWLVWLLIIAFGYAVGWLWTAIFHFLVLPVMPAEIAPYGTGIALAAYAAVLWLILRYL